MMDGDECISIGRQFHQIEIVDATDHLSGELLGLRVERGGDFVNLAEFLRGDILVLEREDRQRNVILLLTSAKIFRCFCLDLRLPDCVTPDENRPTKRK